jgi:hypothetical protein
MSITHALRCPHAELTLFDDGHSERFTAVFRYTDEPQ